MGKLDVKGTMGPRYDEVLTEESLTFLTELHEHFDEKRRALLSARKDRQKKFDQGELPNFLDETKSIREGDWTVAPLPSDLLDRRVEITGPVDRKMIINALNSGAKVFMTDFEDASSPTWSNMVEGQINLKDLWAGKLDFIDESTGKSYSVGPKPAALMVRPRGWHLTERHILVNGERMSGSLFDFGLYAFHNAKTMIDRNMTPAYYLPKMENHKEARLWEEVFSFAEKKLGLKHGTLRCTVLIETLPAAFEMDEILFELKDHILGLNCGRWDYIFSFIKRLGSNPLYLTPDRSVMTMASNFLSAYSLLLIKTCHRRGAFAMGGMAAQIPVKGNDAANEGAFNKVRADKEREATNGHDGTWVAHPGMVSLATEVFDRLMPSKNQVTRQRDDIIVTQDDMLSVHKGERTEAGLRENIRVGVQYIEAWLKGRGAVPLYNLMEDAATAEISRVQTWQWLHHGATLSDGRRVTVELFHQILADEMEKIRNSIGAMPYDTGRFPEAIKLFSEMSVAAECAEFLTLPAYELLD